MWFNNIRFYRLAVPFAMDAAQLDAALRTRPARACGQLEEAVEGWSAPLGRQGQMLVHQAERAMMLCLERQERLLPASVVRDECEERQWQQEAKQGRNLNRREKTEIKEQVIQELLPKAFVRRSRTFACLMPQDGWLIVNASSQRKADALIEFLQKTVSSLLLEIPATHESPGELMRRWMLDERTLPEGFTLEDSCTLTSQGEQGGTIACRQEDLGKDEILAHIRAGKAVSKLALNWRQRVSFVLEEDLSLKRLRFDDAVMEEAADGSGDDEITRFDSDLVIMSGELRQLLAELMQIFTEAT